jgi:hypothetical protein
LGFGFRERGIRLRFLAFGVEIESATGFAAERLLLLEASAKAVQPAVKLIGWFYQAGGAIQDANGKPTFNMDENVEALQFVVDLIQKHKVAPPESSEMIYEDVHNLFMQGRGATAIVPSPAYSSSTTAVKITSPRSESLLAAAMATMHAATPHFISYAPRP